MPPLTPPDQRGKTRKIYLNQDDSAFTRCHPLEDMTVEGLECLVDFYAQGSQLAGLAFCVNMQRALFTSKTWETLIDGFDPALGANQPVFKRAREAAGMAALAAAGIDHPAVWLNRARFHGIEAFLSMRMNDCHGLESHGGFKRDGVKAEDQEHFHWHATEFWKKSPHLRRAPYRFERSFEAAFDYSHEEVRRHHLALIAELFERYDMDGLELDWMRWMFMFAPGAEARGRGILTDFLIEVDALRKRAERRWGRSIQLRHRVPAEPQTCLALGYDAPLWAERGLADQIILSAFGGAANLDYPIELWRRLLGPKVKIIALVESSIVPCPQSRVDNYHFIYGAASSALCRGADGVYLFNECYREAQGAAERRLLLQMLDCMGSAKTLETVVRRHPVSYPQVQAPGEATKRVLPIPLVNPIIGADAARWAENITLRIAVGEKSDRTSYVLRLGFSIDSPEAGLRQMVVRVNAKPVDAVQEPDYEDCMTWAFPGRNVPRVPKSAALLFHYTVPLTLIQDDVNVVEFVPPSLPGTLEWAEFLILPIPEAGKRAKGARRV